MRPVNIGIVGIGGFGESYMHTLSRLEPAGTAKLVSAVIRNPAKYADKLPDLEKRGVTIRSTLTEMLKEDGKKIDIVAIPTGIPQHRPMMIEAVEAGKPVILEKPPTATIQDMDLMEDALRRTGQWCQIGFQSQGNPAIRKLKRMICDGVFGAIKCITIKGPEMRRESYYQRNPWAGKLRVPEGPPHEGRASWVLDGTVMNPFAHQLMNILYFAKPVWNETAEPLWVQGELYRAHHIEAEDTAALRIQLKQGIQIYFFSTLAGPRNGQLEILIEGEKAKAVYGPRGSAVITYADGRVDEFPRPEPNWLDGVFTNAIQYFNGEVKELQCPLQMTRNFVLAANGAWMSSGIPHKIPDDVLKVYDDPKSKSIATEIPEIEEYINRGAAEKKLFSELGAPWAVTRKPFNLAGFKYFDL